MMNLHKRQYKYLYKRKFMRLRMLRKSKRMIREIERRFKWKKHLRQRLVNVRTPLLHHVDEQTLEHDEVDSELSFAPGRREWSEVLFSGTRYASISHI